MTLDYKALFETLQAQTLGLIEGHDMTQRSLDAERAEVSRLKGELDRSAAEIAKRGGERDKLRAEVERLRAPIVLGKCKVVIGTASLTGDGGPEVAVIVTDGEGAKACIGQPYPDMVGMEYAYDDPRLLAVFDVQHPDGVEVLKQYLDLAADACAERIEKGQS